MTAYASENTGAKSGAGEFGGERIRLTPLTHLNPLSYALLLMGGVALTGGLSLLIGWDTYFDDDPTAVGVAWISAWLLGAVSCFTLGVLAARGVLAGDEEGLRWGIFSARKLVMPWTDVAAFTTDSTGKYLIALASKRVRWWRIREPSSAIERLIPLWRRALRRSGRRPVPRAIGLVNILATLLFGVALLMVAARIAWIGRDEPGLGYWVAPGIMATAGLLVAVLPMRRLCRVWYMTAEGLVHPRAGGGELVRWGQIRAISLTRQSEGRSGPRPEMDARLVKVRIETGDRHIRLVIPRRPRNRVERLIIRRARQAAVFVEFTGEVFPPTGSVSLDQLGDLIHRTLRMARRRVLSAAAYMVGALVVLLGPLVVMYRTGEYGLLKVVATWSLLALALVMGGRQSWKLSRVLYARAEALGGDAFAPSRREQFIRQRERFGIAGLWQGVPEWHGRRPVA